MRIALFSGNYNYLKEGANQALNILVRYLEGKAGFQVRVYSPVTDTPAFEPAGTLVAVPSIALPVRGEFRLSLRLPGNIRDDVKRFGPDIVHVSTPDILGCRAETLAEAMGLPIVASMHTRFETYLEHYGLGCMRPLLDAHLGRFYRRADHVVAPTSTLRDELAALCSDEKASVWSRGIDADLFRPDRRSMEWRRSLGIADDEIAILFFGRLVLEKGIKTYVSVLRRLQQSDMRVRPLVVGSGPAEEEFKALDGTILTGHLTGTELARAIASADIMLNPSTTETFGNVLIEAMASGLPIVSADAQNTRSIFTEGRDGLLCRADDVGAYVDALIKLIVSEKLRHSMGDAARRASLSYSWDNASETMVNIYRSLAR